MSTVSFTDLVYTVVKLLDAKWGDDPGKSKTSLDVLNYGTLAIGMIDKHADILTQQFWPMLRSLLVWGVNLQQSGKIIDGYSSSSYEMKVVRNDTYAMVGSETQYY